MAFILIYLLGMMVSGYLLRAEPVVATASPQAVADNIKNQIAPPQANPAFPDSTANYQATIVAPCVSQGGHIENGGCVIPPPPPAPAPAPAPAYYAAPAAPAPAAPAGNCGAWMAAAGITDPVAILVINRESGCNPNAVNRSSGACGIGQQLPCGKWPHQWNDPVGSLIDMQNYVFSVYGSWGSALASENSRGYY